jgi:hypothetical protein
MLRLRGFDSYVMLGGLKAWQKARFPTELIPSDDVVLLPRFD